MQKLNTKSKPVLFLALVILYFFLLFLTSAPNQTIASSGYTCDSAQDFGNTCIDTTGKPRCKAPYSEQCGPSCSRQITCGRSGEFKAGECTCANQGQTTESPATGTVVQNETPTCPVATIWDGATCKGTAVGTSYETKDQPPKENGGNLVADNGQHGGEITRQEGNNLGAGGGGGGGGGGSQSRTGENSGGLNSTQISQLSSCLKDFSNTNGTDEPQPERLYNCQIGDFIYSGTLEQFEVASESGEVSSLPRRLSRSVAAACTPTLEGQDTNLLNCTIDGVEIIATQNIVNLALQGNTRQLERLLIISLKPRESVETEEDVCVLYSISDDGMEFCSEVEGVPTLTEIQTGNYNNETVFFPVSSIVGPIQCPTVDETRSIARRSAICKTIDGGNYWVVEDSGIEENAVIENSQCDRLNQFSDDGELYCYDGSPDDRWLRVSQTTYEGGDTLALSNGEYILCEIIYQTQVHKNINYTCLSSGFGNGTNLWQIQILSGDICNEEGIILPNLICKAGWVDVNNNFIENEYINVANEDTSRIYCNDDVQYNTGRKGYFDNVEYECKRIWVENTQPSSFNLFPKASAQTLPPVPELIDIDNLTPGKYLISIPGFKTAEFTVGNEQVQITFFNDTNGNGTQDANEPTINPKDFATSISKTESIYTINLNLGWNLINLPVANSVIKKASDLSDYIRLTGGDVYQISTYQSGNWVHYVSRINEANQITEFGSDFNIVPGQSYFINSARRSQFRISGNDFLEQPPINIQNGWNLVGFPAQTNQTASEILRYCQNFGTTCQTIARFVDGVYETVVDDFGTIFGNDFQIQKTEGYFILNKGKEGVVRW